MAEPTKPAPSDVDKRLFDGQPLHVQNLAKQSRRELRLAERARYFQANGLRTRNGVVSQNGFSTDRRFAD